MRSRNGLRALSVCLVALGLMAFGGSAAQAAPPEWMVAGKNINSTENSTLLPAVAAALVGTATLHTKILGIKVLIHCTAVGLVLFHLLPGGKFLGRLRFTGCTFLLNEKLSVACEPHTGAEKGVIETNEVEGQLGLHTGSVPVATITPKVGNVFTTIETSEECAVGEEIPILGKFAIKDISAGGIEAELTEHEVEEFATLTKLYAISETEEHVANCLWRVRLFLIGFHNGLKWSGLPG